MATEERIGRSFRRTGLGFKGERPEQLRSQKKLSSECLFRHRVSVVFGRLNGADASRTTRQLRLDHSAKLLSDLAGIFAKELETASWLRPRQVVKLGARSVQH